MEHTGRIYTVVCVGLALMMTGGATAQCNASQCVIASTISFTVHSTVTNECADAGTDVTITCNQGFQRSTGGDAANEYNITITCSGETGEFEDDGYCQPDLMTLLIAVALMFVVLFVFILLVIFIRKRFAKRKQLAMYDHSRDISEIIDGHNEEVGVVNIGMHTMPPSPRSLIPIEDPYDTQHEVGTQTTAEVHYANSSTMLQSEARSSAVGNGDVMHGDVMHEDVMHGDAAAGYGTIGESGMVLDDPQAGRSTENLIHDERREPDGQDSAVDPYASVGDRPLNRARRGPSDASLGGSARVRPVTAHPPVFPDKSASVRAPSGTSADGIPIEALYAKINKVKRASERWPPGGEDPTRPARGRPADLDDLLRNIDRPSPSTSTKNEDSPPRPDEDPKPVEGVYAEVPEHFSSSSVPGNAPPPAPKPARSGKPSGRRPIKRYAPPSRSTSDAGDGAMYTEVDRSQPASNRRLSSNTFAPPTPPPVHGTSGLYAQI